MSEVFVISCRSRKDVDKTPDAEYLPIHDDSDKMYWNSAQIYVTRSGWADKLCESEVFTTEEKANETFEYLTKALDKEMERNPKRVMIKDIQLECMDKKKVALAKLKGI